MNRLRVVALALVAALAAMSVLSVYLVLDGVTDRLAVAEDQAKANGQRADDALATAQKLAEQVRLLGEQPVIEPDATPPPPLSPLQGPRGFQGPTGPQGPRGASCVEELGYPRCRGDEGPGGTNGAAGQPGDVGPVGQPGKDGADGKDGAAGPQGDPGPAGPQGPAGTAVPGSYSCPDGEVMSGFTVAADGSVSITCRPATPLPQGGNQ